MTIRRIEPGLGDKISGQDEWTRAKNTDANFQDISNAAAYMVGYLPTQVPRTDDVARAFLSLVAVTSADFNTLVPGRYQIVSTAANAPPAIDADTIWAVYVEQIGSYMMQTAISLKTGGIINRVKYGATYSAWTPISANKLTYNTTTASGANLVVSSTGVLMRSTSSERFKDNIQDFVLTDEMYEKVMKLKPIKYNSNTYHDDSNVEYYSFSAEKLGEIDESFVLWSDEKGEKEKQAEGLNINAILALQHAISIKQDEKIQNLTLALATLQTSIESLYVK